MIARLGLVVDRKTVRDIITLAVKHAPREMCGLLLGSNNYGVEFRAIENVHEDPERYYRMNADAMMRVWEYAHLNGMDVVSLVHSHPNGEAYPSSTDIRLAAYEDIPYLIVSIKPRALNVFILNGAYRQVSLKVDQSKAGLDYCWCCGRYEDTLRAFQVCFECGHVYRTEQNLIDEHNKVLAELDSYDLDNWAKERYTDLTADFESVMTGAGETVLMRRVPAELGERIYACPMCTHDF